MFDMEFPCPSMGKTSHVKLKLLGLTWNPMSSTCTPCVSAWNLFDMGDMERHFHVTHVKQAPFKFAAGLARPAAACCRSSSKQQQAAAARERERERYVVPAAGI